MQVGVALLLVSVQSALPDGLSLRSPSLHAKSKAEAQGSALSEHLEMSQQLIECVVLSMTSSLDNLAVGFSLGMVSDELSPQLNGIVSLCNAAGALGSSFVGVFLGALAPSAAGFLASAIFAWLGYSEAHAYATNEESILAGLALKGSAWKLALPMTLNNLAGGVAGGLAGVPPIALGVGGFIASFSMMYLGHVAGVWIRPSSTGGKSAGVWLDERLVAASVFLLLAVNQALGTTLDAMSDASS
jgi:putative Mn2+ efflux pump MntP